MTLPGARRRDDEWFVGQRIRWGGEFHDRAGNLVDADDVVITLRPPGVTTSEGLVQLDGDDVARESLGRYYAEHVADVAGTWRWRVESTSSPEVVDEGEREIHASRVLIES